MSREIPAVELDDLGFDGGAHVVVRLALASRAPGEALAVHGTHPDLADDLRTWCRLEGHRLVTGDRPAGAVAVVQRGAAAAARWSGATRAGEPDPTTPGAVVERPPAGWGLAARGAAVEPGGPAPRFRLDHRDELWTDRAGDLYAQALAGQWDPATAIDWDVAVDNDAEVEAAVVQVMTFLVENEEAALVVPARFLGQVHPHFREIQQVLAVTVADEARHIEVFSRRATRSGRPLALSTVGGRASLQTLLEEPDFAVAAFLLSVMGEGTFVSLLGFLERHAPDPLTRRIARLTRADEARHVAFAVAHLERHAAHDAGLRGRLAEAVERRHRELRATAGLNEEVFDALVVLGGGGTGVAEIRRGWSLVAELQRDMADSRRARLARVGFGPDEAEALSALHTRNFM